jgi:hypothetical protein
MVHGIRGAALTAALVASSPSALASVVSGGGAGTASAVAALRSAQEFGNGSCLDVESGCVEVFREDRLPGLEYSAYARGYWVDFDGLGSADGIHSGMPRIDAWLDAWLDGVIDARHWRPAGIRRESDVWGSGAHAAVEVSRTN